MRVNTHGALKGIQGNEYIFLCRSVTAYEKRHFILSSVNVTSILQCRRMDAVFGTPNLIRTPVSGSLLNVDNEHCEATYQRYKICPVQTEYVIVSMPIRTQEM